MNARHSHARGFTLIEMIITLGIFMLLAGAIFGIVGATLESASTLQDNQNREDTAQALENWVRQALLTLPSDGVVVSYDRDDRPAGIVWGSGNDLRALDLEPQPNGNFLLRLASYRPGSAGASSTLSGSTLTSFALANFQTEISSKDPSLNWRSLVCDMKTATWRFRTMVGGDWTAAPAGGRPLMAELTYQRAGDPSAIVIDFWIPSLQPSTNPALPATPVAVVANP